MSFWDADPPPGDDASRGRPDAAGEQARKPRRERPGGFWALLVIALFCLLVGGGWAAAYAAAGDDLPRGTTVEDVAVGGRSVTEAQEALRDGLRDRAVAPITVDAGGRSAEVDPAAAGLSVDLEASVEAAGGGRSWDPQRLWDHYTGGDDLPAVVAIDDERLDAEVDRVVQRLGRPARDGRVRLTAGGVRTRDAVNGTTVDPGEVRTALLDAYLAREPVARVDIEPVEPAIDQADVDRAVEQIANPALSSGVVLRAGGTDVEIGTGQIARLVSVVAVDGALEARVDRPRLRSQVGGRLDRAGRQPRDATVRIRGGRPVVVEARPGRRFGVKPAAAALLTAVTRPEGRRSVPVPARTSRPDRTTKQARRLGVTEKVSEFTTYYPDAEYRNVNIGRAAEIVDGTLLEPGETFSLNGIVGERTRENGFTEGFIISDGILREDLGGGVSQLATTLFNAMYFAGLEDVEHKPHSFYIDRYPVGREATVAWGAIDLRFRNDTEYGVLVDAKVTPSSGGSQGVVTVRMWSTKVWDISSRNSERYDYTAPQTRTLTTPDCYAYTGSSGFTIDVFRTFRRAGQDRVVRTQKFNTVYTPSDGVECADPPAPDDTGGNGGGNGGGGGGQDLGED